MGNPDRVSHRGGEGQGRRRRNEGVCKLLTMSMGSKDATVLKLLNKARKCNKDSFVYEIWYNATLMKSACHALMSLESRTIVPLAPSSTRM